MLNFLNNRIGALMAILVLAIGSISIIGTTHMAKADQVGKVCVFFACGNANITGGTTSSGGGGGQPTPNTATLIVTKECAPRNVVCRPSSFEITVSGNNPSPSTFPGDASGTPVTLGPGSYTVSETPPTGFSVSFDGPDCNASGKGSIAAGDTQHCTVTNTLQSATLKVVKNVKCLPTTTNCPKASEFELNVLATNANPSTFSGDAAGTPVTLTPPDFQVTETKQPTGFTFDVSFSDACDTNGKGTIAAGETKTCTVTNTEKQQTATLNVVKKVTCDTTVPPQTCPVAKDFGLKVIAINANPSTFTGNEGGTTVTLDPGQFDVDEISAPAGFTVVVSFDGPNCDSQGKGTIAAGETKICQVTNRVSQPG